MDDILPDDREDAFKLDYQAKAWKARRPPNPQASLGSRSGRCSSLSQEGVSQQEGGAGEGDAYGV